MKKITKAELIKYLSFGILAVSLIVPIPLLIYSATSTGRAFVLGNYQSYMAPDVMKTLNKEHGLAFDYFETSEDVKKLLKKNTIDISNTTSYDLVDLIQEDLVAKIDWSKFGLSLIDASGVATPITNADEALAIFTIPVQTVLKSYKLNDEAINLLDYGVPYFIQDLVFAYRGQEIFELKTSNNPDWMHVLNAISIDQRFKPTHRPQIVSIDDKRTIYSIPRSIQTNPSEINPAMNASVNDIESTYQLLANEFNKLGSNAINLNSDSNAVLNLVAHNQMAGGFMFNGDALFASNGGDDAIAIAEGDFHVVKPTDALVALDLMIINKNSNGENQMNKAYDVIKQLCLNDGNFDSDSAVDPDQPSSTYQNFDYVNYTPTVDAVYNYVLDNYFEREWQKPILEVTATVDQIELPINNLLKSNFNFAWIGFKNSLK